MAAITGSAQVATIPSEAASRSVLKSCQSSHSVICVSSQLCRSGLSGSSLKGSHRIKVGRGYLDTRKRFRGKWGLKATASAEVGEKVLSAKEKYLQSIYGPPQPPKSENSDLFGGFKDTFKSFTNSGGPGENSAEGEGIKSAARNESAGDAVLSAEEQLVQSVGGGGENQPISKTTDVDVLSGLKDAQNAASDSVNNFKGLTESVDSINDNVVKSATEDGSAGKAVTNAEDSVNKFLQRVTDTVDSVGSSAQGSTVQSSGEGGSPGEALSNSQDSVKKFVEAVTDNVEAGDSSATDNLVKPKIGDGSAGEILSSAKDSVDNFPNVLETVEPAGSSLNESAVKSATEAGSFGDILSSSGESVNGTVQGITDTIDPVGSSATDSVVKSATENGPAGEAVLSAKEKYLQSIGGGLKQSDNNDLFDGLKGADVDVLSGLKDAQGAVTNSVNSLVKSITGAFDAAGIAVKESYENFNGSLVRVLSPATELVDNTVSGIQPNVDGVQKFQAPKVSLDVDFTAPFRMGTPANDALKEVVIVAKDLTGKTLVTAGDLIRKFYSSAKDSLPEDTVNILNELENKVSQAAQPLGEALNQAYSTIIEAEKAAGIMPENPVIPVILVVGGTLFISISWFQSKYGGYAGDLQPGEALDLLKKEGNVVLVDVRPQELRETEGIPDLRRSTRFKFATIEVLKANKTIRSQLKNASEIDSLLTAAVIRNLRNVNGGTKLIILDEDGSQSKEIARGLKKAGTKRAYRVEGGYKAWTNEGLSSKSDVPQTILTYLKEETEALVEEVKPTLGGVLGVSAGLFAAGYAVLEWEKALQLIGVIGLAATIYLRVESYESVEDVRADIQLLQKPFKSLIQSILLLTGQGEKGELQLATSPASSAVQGRMLQAAAKHGAASENDQAEGTSSVPAEVSEEEMASAVDDSELNQSHSASVNQQEPPQ